jgi:hypothetical protein
MYVQVSELIQLTAKQRIQENESYAAVLKSSYWKCTAVLDKEHKINKC